MKKQEKNNTSAVLIDFSKVNKKEDSTEMEFDGVKFRLTKNIGFDRYLGISKTLLNAKREEVLARDISFLVDMDIYTLVSEFKLLILSYYTDVEVLETPFPVIEESGFVTYVLSNIINYKEMYDLFLTEISILNSQLLVHQLSNSIPNVEKATSAFNDSIQELSNTDKDLLSLVINKKIKEDIVKETKEEKYLRLKKRKDEILAGSSIQKKKKH